MLTSPFRLEGARAIPSCLGGRVPVFHRSLGSLSTLFSVEDNLCSQRRVGSCPLRREKMGLATLCPKKGRGAPPAPLDSVGLATQISPRPLPRCRKYCQRGRVGIVVECGALPPPTGYFVIDLYFFL